jgi:flagellar FliJ protein
MKKFRFRLQKVLELRERLEKESATKLAEARTQAELAQRERDTIATARDKGVAEAGKAAGTPVSAGELQRIARMIEQFDQHLQVAEEKAGEADARVGGLVVEFEQAFTRRRVMDRLRERHLATWREGEVRVDRSNMDAIALQRHTRKKTDGDAA